MTQAIDKVENVEVDGVTYPTESLTAQQKALVSLYEEAFAQQKEAERRAYVFSRGAQRIADELVENIRAAVVTKAAEQPTDQAPPAEESKDVPVED